MINKFINADSIRNIMSDKKLEHEQESHISLNNASKIIEDAILIKMKKISSKETTFSTKIKIGSKPLKDSDFARLKSDFEARGLNIVLTKEQELEPYTDTHITGGTYVPAKYNDVYYTEVSLI